jgi:hypothetical protein
MIPFFAMMVKMSELQMSDKYDQQYQKNHQPTDLIEKIQDLVHGVFISIKYSYLKDIGLGITSPNGF